MKPQAKNFILRNYKRKFSFLKRKFSKNKRSLCEYFSYILIVLVIIFLALHFGFVFKFKRIRYEKIQKIDWHDWNRIGQEKQQTGIGENGEAGYLLSYPPSTKQINDTHGYNGYLSDVIALNRSLKDLRPTEYIRVCNVHFIAYSLGK